MFVYVCERERKREREREKVSMYSVETVTLFPR